MSKDRYLIINTDDYGMCYATNMSNQQLLKEGYITSATIMVPCPWFPQAAKFCRENPEVNVGIHLTLNSEWELYRWRPLLGVEQVPSLVNDEGYFYDNIEDVFKKANHDEIRAELRKQVDTALAHGIKLTHLDNHMGSLWGPGFNEIAFELSLEYKLPYRFSRRLSSNFAHTIPGVGDDDINRLVKEAESKGFCILDTLLTPDYSVEGEDSYELLKEQTMDLFNEEVEGLSEFFIHPMIDTKEARAINPTWQRRVWEHRLIMDPDVRQIFKDREIELVSWQFVKDRCRF